uniref:PHD-type domain-containing protein n=1 Tax=Poecilia latipinna TaxID=48699 RepID=A0A3B3UBI2_9TELE
MLICFRIQKPCILFIFHFQKFGTFFFLDLTCTNFMVLFYFCFIEFYFENPFTLKIKINNETGSFQQCCETVDAMADKCYICLCPFEKQTVGSLDQCHHFFCFQCIYQWSQTANTCPVDRISFAFIHQRRCPGGDIQKKGLKVTPRRNDDDTEDDWRNIVICEECGRSGRRDRLLVCRLCDSGYHMDCLTPPLDTVPEGDWMCPECVITSKSTGIYLMSKMITSLLLLQLLQLLTCITFHNVSYDGIIGGLGDSVGTNCAFAIEAF